MSVGDEWQLSTMRYVTISENEKFQRLRRNGQADDGVCRVWTISYSQRLLRLTTI
jgi:hypothetical protein